MTEPVSELRIVVPSDLAERLAQEPDPAAYLLDAARTRMRVEQVDALFAERGIKVTPEGIARAAARRAAVEQEWTPDRWAEARDRVSRGVNDMFGDQPGRQASAA